ncbi:CPBP family intramembrane glutamic endopeptidase [Curtobacterium sp. VKM Ac-2922]|uniref:CPBP family intramembrane glutamic endopeptidase n=1 Tax=Curtobacterium sp. VKM Ac-2922 TaxID=2929475 RepID=UPI001FB2DE95|nr:CPBP family intramembrane glutamic endopeptidase [Curtobacterium sp. VKM Ac-2922]MCJ1714891.1 CPBP family intramembrane metalloprotease [Curtobacterium sp. VKM Ac-2922]
MHTRTPRLWIAVTVTAVVVVLVYLMQWLIAPPGGTADYSFQTAAGVLHFGVLPEAIPLVVLLAAVVALPWRRDTLFEADTPRRSWWLVVPVLLFVLIWVKYPFTDIALDVPGLASLALWALCIGLLEELLIRGVLLTGLRVHVSELVAYVVSTLAFAVIHAGNVFNGQEIGDTIGQIVLSVGMGSVLYVSRRVTGTLIVPVVLHAMWDFSVFSLPDDFDGTGPAGILLLATVALAVVGGIPAAIVVARRRGNPLRAASSHVV